MATIGFSKVFILDKYFTELQKFWETEKKLQGMHIQDASSSNEAAHLEQKLKNLSSELVTLRNRLHVNGQPAPLELTHGNGPLPLGSQAGPIIPPHQTNSTSHQQSNYPNKPLPPHPIQHHLNLSNNINDGPHPPQSYLTSSSNNNNNNIHSNNNPLANNHINNNNNNNNNNHHQNNHGSISANSNNAHSNNGALNSHQNGIYQQGYYVNQSFQKDVMGLSSPGGGSGAVVGVSNCSSTTSSPCSGEKLTSSKLIERVDVVAGISSLNLVNNNNGSSGGGGSRTSTGNGHQHSSSNQNSSASNGGNSITGGVTTSAGSVIVGTPTGTNSGGDATQSESSFKLSSKSAPESRRVNLSDIEDLIHLPGPLTEDALIRCLQARCSSGKYSVYMGPILLMTNRLRSLGNPMTLASTADVMPSPPVRKVVAEALRQQGDTGYPQAIILSGASGSGKTYTSMLILRQLFQLAGGGVESDAFKHLAASITVLRSLGTARTPLNRDSSRVGHFIEVQVTDGTVYRTKVHCYFLDQTRVVKRAVDENNYHIFYQMLAGLSHEERERLHLGEQSVDTLCYLSNHRGLDPEQDAKRFMEWKASLSMLGIPFLDVVRVLAAVLLVGNVNFKEAPSSMEIKVEGETELQAAAGLLGVSETALKQGLTMRTQNIRNQLVRSRCDGNLSNYSRDALAKSLYCRTVATIVRRANSLKRLGSNSGTLSSDSADSVNNQAEVASQHASTVGTAGSKASKSMTALNNAVRHATDGFIGILDMFGFEDLKPSHLEHLCINLCAETMQHFYNTHIFKASIESCRDEGIHCDLEVDYVDNVPCIDLISSLRTGLLSMLDVECSVRGTVESYIQKLNTQHKQNPRLLDTNISKTTTELRSFAIQHYAGKVQYDATEFLETNRDILADDLVAVFHKHRCSFGFASHLFSSELKVLGAGGMEPSPRGISFRISPTSHTELLNGDEPVSTLTQDFHTRLDNLLRTLVHAKPHFIRCIKINQSEQPDLFDRHAVSKQLRAFQVLETVNLMAHGYPHRMRFKAFNGRYKSLAPFHQLNRTDDRAVEDAQLILDAFYTSIGGSCWSKEYLSQISVNWALGKRHIFLSEGARQRLESVRASTRNGAATILQSTWRGHRVRQRWPFLSQQSFHSKFKFPCQNENYPHQNSNNHNNPPPAPANLMSASAFLPPLIPPSSSTTTSSSVAMATITRHPLPTPPTAPASVQIHGPHPPKSSPLCQTPILGKGSSAIGPNGNNHLNPGRINNSNNYVNDTGGSSSSRNSSPLVKHGHHQHQSMSQSHSNDNNLEPPPMSPYSNNSSSGASMVYSSVQNSGSSNHHGSNGSGNHNGIHISTSNVISSSSKKDWTMSGGGFKDKGQESSGGHPVPAPRAMVLHPSSVSSVTSTLHSTLPQSVGGVLAQSPPPTQGTGTMLQPNAPNSVCSSTNSNASGGGGRPPRPQPIAGTPPPDPGDKCDPKLVQQTCNLFGLDMERPPPLPPSRSYTVAGNTKLGYPQTRVMKMTYPDEGTNSEVRLLKGETVTVIGTSPRRGHLMVEHKSRTLHVPFQYLELKPPASSTTNPSATTATTTVE